MSSTDRERLAVFFREQLVPLAQRFRNRGVSFFPLGPEPEAESWYVDVPAGEPEFVELEPADYEPLLRELWEQQELPELAAMTGAFIRLASTLETDVEQTADVSPTIYVMH